MQLFCSFGQLASTSNFFLLGFNTGQLIWSRIPIVLILGKLSIWSIWIPIPPLLGSGPETIVIVSLDNTNDFLCHKYKWQSHKGKIVINLQARFNKSNNGSTSLVIKCLLYALTGLLRFLVTIDHYRLLSLLYLLSLSLIDFS